MTVSELRDIYTDFLIVQTDKASATACSELLNNAITHDRFTRLLSRSNFDSQYLWEDNKSFIRKHQNASGVLSLDNSILHKPHTAQPMKLLIITMTTEWVKLLKGLIC